LIKAFLSIAGPAIVIIIKVKVVMLFNNLLNVRIIVVLVKNLLSKDIYEKGGCYG